MLTQLLDVTVINPLQDATVERAAAEPGHALGVAFNRKMRGAEEECLRQGIRFMPVVAETLGGWDKVAIREIKKLAAAKARHLGNEEGEEVRKAFGRLSCSCGATLPYWLIESQLCDLMSVLESTLSTLALTSKSTLLCASQNIHSTHTPYAALQHYADSRMC